MPPKSRHNKVEWTQCCQCQWKFSVKDLQLHQEICQKCESDSGCIQLPLSVYKHDFVLGKVLVTQSIIAADKPEHLSKSQSKKLIFMNPSLMRMCGFNLGKFVLIQNHELFAVWPHRTLPLTSVAFLNDTLPHITNLMKGCQLIVSEVTEHITLAREVHCLSEQEATTASTKELCQVFASKAGEIPIRAGNKVSFSFYGQQCSMLITKISNFSTTSSTLQQCRSCGNHTLCKQGRTESDIEQDFQHLTLQEISSNKDLSSCDSCTCKLTVPVPEAEKPVFYNIDQQTKIILGDNHKDKKQTAVRTVLSDIGGLDNEVKTIKELMSLHLKRSLTLRKHNVSTPRGVLLYGPSGTGKSLLVKALAHSSQAHVVEILGPDVWSKFYGESESKLTALFREAMNEAPSVVILDEINALCPKRESSRNETEKRLVTCLLTLLDTSNPEAPVFVLAATCKPDDLDPALRRPGRLDREIEIGVPSISSRTEILKTLLNPMAHTLTENDIQEVASQAHSYVGADLSALCKEANMRSIRRCEEREGDACVVLDDMKLALSSVKPSAMREVAIEVPKVSWSDIGGQNELKYKLKQAIEWPLKHPDAFQRLGIRPPRGLLMYGPPGCSKTMIAKALAKESGINFISIKGPELFSKWVGESERAVRDVFRKARSAAPAIVFFDEIDALAVERSSGGGGGGDVADRVLAQLLTEIDGVEALQDVTIVAATNRPDRIDKALMRPGRLDRIVYVPLPDRSTRREIFMIHFMRTPVSDDVDLDWLVENTEQYSGAEVSAVCQEAALGALQQSITSTAVSKRHFISALETVKPRITPQLSSFYENYAQSSGLHSL